MKYLDQKLNENIEDFTRRLKFEIRIERYFIHDVSSIMGKGIQVITLVNETLSNTIKIEVSMYDLEEITNLFKHLSMKKTVKRIKRTNDLDDINDLYK